MSKRFWTAEETEILRQFYPDVNAVDLAKVMGMKVDRLYSKAAQLGLKKSEAFLKAELQRQGDRLREAGKNSRFHSGQTSWNKGKKGLDFGGKETRFKPGNVPHNHKPVGYERINVDGYIERKVTDDGPSRFHFRQLHRIVWEEFHGPVPEGFVVVFKNRNKLDVRLENLELISRKDLQARNTIHRYPEELKQVIHAKAVLSRRINKMEKERAEQNDAS